MLPPHGPWVTEASVIGDTETSASARFATTVGAAPRFKISIDGGRVLFEFIRSPEKVLGPNVKSSNSQSAETLHSDKVKSKFNPTYLNEVQIKYISTLNIMYECLT